LRCSEGQASCTHSQQKLLINAAPDLTYIAALHIATGVLKVQIERLTGPRTWSAMPLRLTIQSAHRKEAVSTKSRVLQSDSAGCVDLTECEPLSAPYFSLGDGVPSTDNHCSLKVQHAETQAVLCEGRLDCQSALTSSSSTVILHGSSGDGSAEVQVTFTPHAAQQLLGSAAVLLRCFVAATTLFNQQVAQPRAQLRARWNPDDSDLASIPVEPAPSCTAHIAAHDEFEWNAVFDLQLTAPVSGAVSITLCLDCAAVALCEVPAAALLAAGATGQWRSLRAVPGALQQRSRNSSHAEAVGELLIAGVLLPVIKYNADITATTATASTTAAAAATAAATAAANAALQAREPAALYVHAWDAIDIRCLGDAALYLSVRLIAPATLLLVDGAAAGAERCCTRPVLSATSSSGRLLWDEQLPTVTLQHCCAISSDGVCNAGSSSSDSSWTVELQLVNARALDKDCRVLAAATMPISELWRDSSSCTDVATAKHSDAATQPSVHSLTLRPCAAGILAAAAKAAPAVDAISMSAAVAGTVRVRLATLLVPLATARSAAVAAQIRAFTQRRAEPMRMPAADTAPVATVSAVKTPAVAAVPAADITSVKPVKADGAMVNAETAYSLFQSYADAADSSTISATAIAALCTDHCPKVAKGLLPTTTAAAAALTFEQFLVWLRSLPQSALSEQLLITPRGMLDSIAALEATAAQRIAALQATFATAAGASHSAELSCATAVALRERALTAWNSSDSWAAHVAAAKSDVHALAAAVAAAEAVNAAIGSSEQQQQQQCGGSYTAAELAQRCLKLSQVLVDMKEALRRASDRFFALPRPETTSDDDDTEQQQQQQQWYEQSSDTAAAKPLSATVRHDKRQMLMRGRVRPSTLSSTQPLVLNSLLPVAAAQETAAVRRRSGITFDEPVCAALLAQIRAVVQLQAVVRDLRERCTAAATSGASPNKSDSPTGITTANSVKAATGTTIVSSAEAATAIGTGTAATASAVGSTIVAAPAATVKRSALETVQRLRAYQTRHCATVNAAVSDKQARLSATAPPSLQAATATAAAAVESPPTAVRSTKQSASKSKVSPALNALRQQRWDSVVSAMSEAGVTAPASLKDAVLCDLTSSGVLLDRHVPHVAVCSICRHRR
jgi:hypothetical protein